jgi:hypothetical protein
MASYDVASDICPAHGPPRYRVVKRSVSPRLLSEIAPYVGSKMKCPAGPVCRNRRWRRRGLRNAMPVPRPRRGDVLSCGFIRGGGCGGGSGFNGGGGGGGGGAFGAVVDAADGACGDGPGGRQGGLPSSTSQLNLRCFCQAVQPFNHPT